MGSFLLEVCSSEIQLYHEYFLSTSEVRLGEEGQDGLGDMLNADGKELQGDGKSQSGIQGELSPNGKGAASPGQARKGKSGRSSNVTPAVDVGVAGAMRREECVHLNHLLTSLTSLLYTTLRPRVIVEGSLEKLCEVVTVLKFEVPHAEYARAHTWRRSNITKTPAHKYKHT